MQRVHNRCGGGGTCNDPWLIALSWLCSLALDKFRNNNLLGIYLLFTALSVIINGHLSHTGTHICFCRDLYSWIYGLTIKMEVIRGHFLLGRGIKQQSFIIYCSHGTWQWQVYTDWWFLVPSNSWVKWVGESKGPFRRGIWKEKIEKGAFKDTVQFIKGA